VAGGDSGSPAFVAVIGRGWRIAGVNTFVSPEPPSNAQFGGLGGGVLVYSYAHWIDSVVHASAASATRASPVPEPAGWLQLLVGIGLVATAALGMRAAQTRMGSPSWRQAGSQG
jgi:hypothetical protein